MPYEGLFLTWWANQEVENVGYSQNSSMFRKSASSMLSYTSHVPSLKGSSTTKLGRECYDRSQSGEFPIKLPHKDKESQTWETQ